MVTNQLPKLSINVVNTCDINTFAKLSKNSHISFTRHMSFFWQNKMLNMDQSAEPPWALPGHQGQIGTT